MFSFISFVGVLEGCFVVFKSFFEICCKSYMCFCGCSGCDSGSSFFRQLHSFSGLCGVVDVSLDRIDLINEIVI